jgi:hypothetical protein
MKQRPPLNDSIAFALARMVDDVQTGRRDPSHSNEEEFLMAAVRHKNSSSLESEGNSSTMAMV